jgi:hypothetical protein
MAAPDPKPTSPRANPPAVRRSELVVLHEREGQLPAAHPAEVGRRGRVHGVDDRE